MSVTLLLLLLNVAAAVIPVVGKYLANTRTSQQNDAETVVSGGIEPLAKGRP